MVRTSIHNNIDPSWLPHTPEILYNNGFVVWEFWKTLVTLKSETTWLYISEKKDIKTHNSKPFVAILLNCNTECLFFLWEIINWKIEKNKANQSEKFPKDGIINWIDITTFEWN